MSAVFIFFKASAFTLLVVLLCACDDKRVFEDNRDLASKSWYVDSVLTFQFEVKEPEKPYNLLINIRNSENYPYYNLFQRYYLSDSSGQELKSQQTELILMDPKTGRPLGKGLGDIYSHQFELLGNFTFPKKGKYTIKLKQYMRENPLPEVYSVGFRLEEVGTGKK